ncbi:MAG: hypothetical protein JRN15_21200, partial [Nitrososphaerota archaeon]|nr:hypothetical protein [Nitrososphaerota archaeon]
MSVFGTNTLTYFATSITLATTKTSLLDYINGTTAGAGHTNADITACREVDFLADSTNGGTVYVGDLDLSTTDYGTALSANGTQISRKSLVEDRIDLSDIYLLGSAAGEIVHVS